MDNTGCFGKACSVILILLATSCLSPGLGMGGVSSPTADTCIACHEDVWRDIQNKKYIHKPVREKDCKYCHAATPGNVDSKREAYLNKVTWVARSISQSREHWLEIDGVKRGGTLLVESRSPGGFSAREFPLPALDELEELPVTDLKAIGNRNIRLLEVTTGVFVSVTIGWETDRPTNSQVFYGMERLDQRSNLDTQYTTRHAVTLTGVKLGRSYKYKVVSVDVAGNRSESGVQTMVAEVVPVKRDEVVGGVALKEPVVSVRYYRKGNKCIVVVGSEDMVSVVLGLLPKKYDDDEPENATKVIRHLPLNSPEVTNIGVCYGCHVEYKKILTHPINVYPKRGMIIPPEYATLPDGRISCMSCHVTHASNVEFRLVKADRRDLCRGCHKDIS